MGYSRKNTIFCSEPGPIKDHGPIPNVLTSTFTVSAFAKHSSLLPFLTKEMSFKIDINKILPLKVAGVCPIELIRSLILSQSCNVVNPGKITRILSILH